MKLVQINNTCGIGSTGKICVAVSELLSQQGVENDILYTSYYGEHPLGYSYMTYWQVKFQALRSRILGNYGFNSRAATKRLIARLEQIQPDVVQLHNLHAHNCDLQMLIEYLKDKNIRIVWTFHDCWAFTGYCPHYDHIGCSRWKTGCHKCPQKKRYSWFFDRSHFLFEKKKELLTTADLTIVAPSKWMASQVKSSFLNKCHIEVISNGVDLSVFYPKEDDFREKYGCEGRFIVLGVAFDWGQQKGLDVFTELANSLDERFQIVLVGIDEDMTKQLPPSVITLRRTYDEPTLASIYSAADVFVNPTKEETQGLTNLEALACGTPVITFNSGGSPECCDESCAVVVPKGDVPELQKQIIRVCEERPFTQQACVERAKYFVETNQSKLLALLKSNSGSNAVVRLVDE